MNIFSKTSPEHIEQSKISTQKRAIAIVNIFQLVPQRIFLPAY